MKGRLTQNVMVNKGYYVRPDDNLSWSPPAVYPTPKDAWIAWHKTLARMDWRARKRPKLIIASGIRIRP